MYVRVTVNFYAQDQKVAALFCTSYFSADPLRLMEGLNGVVAFTVNG